MDGTLIGVTSSCRAMRWHGDLVFELNFFFFSRLYKTANSLSVRYVNRLLLSCRRGLNATSFVLIGVFDFRLAGVFKSHKTFGTWNI